MFEDLIVDILFDDTSEKNTDGAKAMANTITTYLRDLNAIDGNGLNENDRASLYEFVQTQGSFWQPEEFTPEGIHDYMEEIDFDDAIEVAPAGIRDADVSDEEKAAALKIYHRRSGQMNGWTFNPNWSIYFRAPLLSRPE